MTRGDGRTREPDALWICLRGHWASGLLPLAFLTEISRPALFLASAAFLAGAFLDWIDSPRRGWHRAASPLLAGGTAAAAADLAFGSGDLLQSASLLVLGVQSVKFLLPKTHRDGWQLCAISFLEFLTAAASTTEIQFAAFLFLFVGLSAGAMWALQAEESSATAGIPVPRASPGFAAAFLLLSAVSGFCLTGLLFVVTPRIGLGQFLLRADNEPGITGFSDSISLRDVTAVKVDRRIVARIEFPDHSSQVHPDGMYLRGAAYDRFDGSTWRKAKTPIQRVQNAGSLYFLSPYPSARLSQAEIFLEPRGHASLLLYPGAVTVEGALGEIRTDGRGNYLLPTRYSAIRYRVLFLLEAPHRRMRNSKVDSAYLALPPGSDSIRELADRITAGADSEEERADRITRFFRTGFRYTLSDAAASVEEFLFRKRAGFCEHYAASLTLLLRSAGIPARVAAGYLGGEWSDLGNYLIVRQSDAHAWTEAWIGGRWVTIDATPPQGENSPFFSRTGTIGMYLDWGRQRWNKYVVNYSLRMQAEAVSGGWFAMRRAGARLRGMAGFSGARHTRKAAAILLAAATGWIAWRLRPGRDGRGPARDARGESPLPKPYVRLIRRLATSGLRKSPGTPLEEMIRSATCASPRLLPEAERFLFLYHRDRFGPRPLSAGESSEAFRLADRLRRGLFRPEDS